MCRVRHKKKSCLSAIYFADKSEEEEEEKQVSASGCVDAAADRRRSAGRRNAEDQVLLPSGESWGPDVQLFPALSSALGKHRFSPKHKQIPHLAARDEAVDLHVRRQASFR